MFSKFNQEKTRYDSGQIFPFLIALICVALILMMMTINLGMIGIYKTDVSVAADAAALSGASILSQTLLGLGLKSDSMCGKFWVMFPVAIVELIAGAASTNPVLLLAGAATFIALAISEICSYIMAFEEGMMGWSNAKKTAMQYAFQNAGIDEPRPTFKQFMESVKGYYGWGGISVDGLGPEQVQRLYTAYVNGDDPDFKDKTRIAIRDASQNGFYRFMSALPKEKRGYWPKGEITPIHPGSSFDVVSGYGWEPGPGGAINNSFDNNDNYKNFENWVEVKVSGSTLYVIEPKDLFSSIIDEVFNWIKERIKLPWEAEWIEGLLDIYLEIIRTYLKIVLNQNIPNGLHILKGDMEAQTDKLPLVVTVKRSKPAEMNLGLWKFRYPPLVSIAKSHAFCQTGQETIDPANVDPIDVLWEFITGVFSGSDFWEQGGVVLFDINRHLFETKLIYAR